MNTFKEGEQLSLLDEVGSVKVIKSNGDQVCVEDEWGIAFWVPAAKLVRPLLKLKGELVPDGIAASRDVDQKLKKGATSKKASHSKREEDIWELDLHMEELNPNASTQSKSYQHALAAQLSAFRTFIKRAKNLQQQNVVVIHGEGDGVLKSEIHLQLMQMGQTTFSDADINRYGKGATQIVLDLS